MVHIYKNLLYLYAAAKLNRRGLKPYYCCSSKNKVDPVLTVKIVSRL